MRKFMLGCVALSALFLMQSNAFAGGCQTVTSVGVGYTPVPVAVPVATGHCAQPVAVGVGYNVGFVQQRQFVGMGYNTGFVQQRQFVGNNFGNGGGAVSVRSTGIARLLGIGGPDVNIGGGGVGGVGGGGVSVQPTGLGRLLGIGGPAIRIR